MHRNIKNTIMIALIILTIAWIFGHSIMSPEQSSAESSWVKDFLAPFFELFVGKGNVSEYFIRKLAHFSEFALLGFEVGLLFRERLSLGRISLPLFIVLLTALTDETIQSFTGRGADVRDVWIDFLGACTGLIIIRIVLALHVKRSKLSEDT